jgi:hypothetical protein
MALFRASRRGGALVRNIFKRVSRLILWEQVTGEMKIQARP